MARLSFTKLGLKKNEEKVIKVFNEQEIEIKQYLSIGDKLALIEGVINTSLDGNNFINPLRVKVNYTMNIIKYYTNISFTTKQEEDIIKTYDLLEGSGLVNIIFESIPCSELDFIYKNLVETIEYIYNYNSSVLGVLENVRNNYNETDMDLTAIGEQLKGLENVELLKDIVQKLG